VVDFDFDPEEIVRYGTKPISLGGGDFFNRDSPDELGSGGNCSDFLDCLEVPTLDKGDFRHNRLLHGVLRGIRTHSSRWLLLMHDIERLTLALVVAAAVAPR